MFALCGVTLSLADVRVWTDQEEKILKGDLKGIEVLPATPSLPNAPVAKRLLPPAPKPVAPVADRVIRVKSSRGLFKAINNARPGDVITLAPGTYGSGRKKNHVRRSGEPGRPIVVRAQKLGEVVIRFDSVEGFRISGSHWVFENLDIVGTCATDTKCEHAFHIVGKADFTVIRNNRIHEFNAAIKGNGIVIEGKRVFPNDVLIENNAFYNSAPRKTESSVTPIDVVGGRRWIVRGNFIADFARTGGSRVSFAAFFKGNSRDGVFERNLVICEYMHKGGIRVGLSFGGGGTGQRWCEEGSCKREHTNGIMRNNIIANCPSDVGIYLNKATDTKIYNNTLYDTVGIDVRFDTSSADIRNNIMSGRIRNRNGGRHTAGSNLRGVGRRSFETWFAAPNRGDFRFLDSARIADKGEALPEVTDDFCGNPRRDGTLDIGAIEVGEGTSCDTLRLTVTP